MSTAPSPSANEIQYAARQLVEGRPQEAIAVLERLSRDFPAFVSAHVLLAKSYRSVGRKEEALAAWHQAYQLMPGSPLIVQQRRRLLEEGWEDAAPTPGERTETPAHGEDVLAASPEESAPALDDFEHSEAPPADSYAPTEPEVDEYGWSELSGPGDPDEAGGHADFAPGSADFADDEASRGPGADSEWPASEALEDDDVRWVDLESTEPTGFVVPDDGWRVVREEEFSEDRRDVVHEAEVTPPESSSVPPSPWSEETVEGEGDQRELPRDDAGAPDVAPGTGPGGFDLSDEWLDVQGDQADAAEAEEDILQQSQDLDSLIERLENAPRIQPAEDPFSRAGDAELSDEVVTVTLARIYENQQQFTAAAHVYERLAQEQPARAEEFGLKAAEMRRRAQD